MTMAGALQSRAASRRPRPRPAACPITRSVDNAIYRLRKKIEGIRIGRSSSTPSAAMGIAFSPCQSAGHIDLELR